MSQVRVSVEWLFGDVVNYFKFLDFKKVLKICLSAIGKIYIICALMHNARACLYGSTTSEFFEMSPQLSRTTFSDKKNVAENIIV